MKQALNEFSVNSPLLRSYKTTISILERQTEELQRLQSGWLDQEELIQRVLLHQQKMTQTLQERRADYRVSDDTEAMQPILWNELVMNFSEKTGGRNA